MALPEISAMTSESIQGGCFSAAASSRSVRKGWEERTADLIWGRGHENRNGDDDQTKDGGPTARGPQTRRTAKSGD